MDLRGIRRFIHQRSRYDFSYLGHSGWKNEVGAGTVVEFRAPMMRLPISQFVAADLIKKLKS